jgi:predicted nucleotidyltransferase
MSQPYPYPQVDEALLEQIVRRILAVGSPQKIVLFGSRARGDYQPDSDIDLLIIEESDLPRFKRSSRYRKALVGIFPAKDIVVRTPEEVKDWEQISNAFITTVLEEGKILYEKQI